MEHRRLEAELGQEHFSLQKKDTSVTFWAERKKFVIHMTLL